MCNVEERRARIERCAMIGSLCPVETERKRIGHVKGIRIIHKDVSESMMKTNDTREMETAGRMCLVVIYVN